MESLRQKYHRTERAAYTIKGEIEQERERIGKLRRELNAHEETLSKLEIRFLEGESELASISQSIEEFPQKDEMERKRLGQRSNGKINLKRALPKTLYHLWVQKSVAPLKSYSVTRETLPQCYSIGVGDYKTNYPALEETFYEIVLGENTHRISHRVETGTSSSSEYYDVTTLRFDPSWKTITEMWNHALKMNGDNIADAIISVIKYIHKVAEYYSQEKIFLDFGKALRDLKDL